MAEEHRSSPWSSPVGAAEPDSISGQVDPSGCFGGPVETLRKERNDYNKTPPSWLNGFEPEVGKSCGHPDCSLLVRDTERGSRALFGELKWWGGSGWAADRG